MWRACLLWLLALGCPKRDQARTDPVPELLAQSDSLWEDRGQGGFSPVERVLLEAWAVQPHNPEVQWRLVRLKVGEGMAAESQDLARYTFAEARALGIQCLDDAPTFRQQRVERTWEAAIERVPPERARCAAWTSLAWARWLSILGGAAGSVDLQEIDALVAGIDDDDDAVVAWARGVVAAVRPDWAGQDLQVATVQLERAIAARPRELSRRVDLFLLAQPQGGNGWLQARAQLMARPARTPEDHAALRRLQAAVASEVAPRASSQ